MEKLPPERSETGEETGSAQSKMGAFRSLTERLLKVPKPEIEKEEAKWNKKQNDKP